ncbi:ribbon-helix-helix domain-containing protein [Nitratireductor aquimarinus]|uniref:ribbon-helix-helix domain-containing protein n=1 Tax=Alphaproteobacteria TaxID=28211 RepID=UPI0019D37624|nr:MULTISPECIES: ribbon-helix-helix domain-containing protein [Alphaproteobacteria]MBY6022163.1 ribbon-helix-helix domain-containing protein [Nitratireductor sp. DP7N14-4]MBN7757375.1 ribbon-helix-helix domain-containing protein [Nitratireductor aquimarinus]MBN8242887.1 ribbon-helix-helix domain-containing protein [Nitratireductor aquimarinus]MBY6000135.1 ribbon-helix-helix domain-containing protein [Tritonibacter mobilis]MBY6131987.1 ribbon-helix-helix domain-containing protein [Nitratireduct
MSGIAKRSVSIRGHRTSISLEKPFLQELEAIARRQNMPLATLIAEVDENRSADNNLSSELRLHVLRDLKARLEETNDKA